MSLEDIVSAKDVAEVAVKNLRETVDTLQTDYDSIHKEFRFVSECLYAVLQTVDKGVLTDFFDIRLEEKKLEKLGEWYTNYKRMLEVRRKEIVDRAKLKLTAEEIEALGL